MGGLNNEKMIRFFSLNKSKLRKHKSKLRVRPKYRFKCLKISKDWKQTISKNTNKDNTNKGTPGN